jgi:hypothetical protein
VEAAGEYGDLGPTHESVAVASLLTQALVRVQRERPGLVDPIEHSQQPGAERERERRRVAYDLIEALERLGGWHGAEDERHL